MMSSNIFFLPNSFSLSSSDLHSTEPFLSSHASKMISNPAPPEASSVVPLS